MAGESGVERRTQVVTYTELEIMELKNSRIQIASDSLEMIKSFAEFSESQKKYMWPSRQKSGASSDYNMTTESVDNITTNESSDSNHKARNDRKQTFSFSNNKMASNKSVFHQHTTRRGRNQHTEELIEEKVTKKQEGTKKSPANEAAKEKGPETANEKLNAIPSFEYKESDKEWCYLDPNGKIQGPFTSSKMIKWYNYNYLPHDLKIKSNKDVMYTLLKQQIQTLGYLPFYEEVNKKLESPEKCEKVAKTTSQTVQQPTKAASQQNGDSNIFVQSMKYSTFQKVPDPNPKKFQSLLSPNADKKVAKSTSQTSIIADKKGVASPVKNIPHKNPDKVKLSPDDVSEMQATELLQEAKQINKSALNKPLKKEGWSKPKSTIKVALNFQDVLKIEEERSRKEHELQQKLKKKFESLSYAERMALKK